MRFTRRELLRGAGSLAGAVLLNADAIIAAHRTAVRKKRATPNSRIIENGPLSGAKLYEDVIAYYNLGEHRTATQVDLKTSQWLLDQLRGAGLKATVQSFPLRQFFVRQTRLSIGEKSIRAFPLWFPRATGPDPIVGRLAAFDKRTDSTSVQGRLAFVKFPPDAGTAIGSVHSDLVLSAAKAGALSVIAVTEGPTREIIALNSPAESRPWPVPVVLIGPRDEAALVTAMKSGTSVALLLEGDDASEAIAKNVIARVDRGKDLFVVSTPQSGWFRCAGERGPGIALFLGLARWAVRRASGSSFLFVSTSGHEIGGLGMRAFLKDLAPTTDRVLCWIHLGAGIATYSWEESPSGLKRLPEADSRRFLMTTKELTPILAAAFSGLPGLTPTSSRAVGEYEFMLEAGYRIFGIAAGHRFHHTPADSPEMTGPEILEPVGRALLNAIEMIEKKGKG